MPSFMKTLPRVHGFAAGDAGPLATAKGRERQMATARMRTAIEPSPEQVLTTRRPVLHGAND